jgi:predicted phage terminase large subunit-like protein
VKFLENWHIRAIAYYLELVEQGYINRLIITMPPRHLKSISASVAFPAWLLGRNPYWQIVCASYSQELSDKHALDMRRVMQRRWYQDVFPATRFDLQRNPLRDMMTTRGGYRLSTSVGGSLTGRGGNMLILDDPHKAHEVESDVIREGVIEWFRNTLLTRLNHPDDPIILIQQRLHEDDLAGYLLATGEWDHLNLPAIAEEEEWIEIGPAEDDWHHRRKGDLLHPERVSQEKLDEIRSHLGPYLFEAQFQQRPAPLGGGLIKLEWFETYDSITKRLPGDQVGQCWDPAQSITENADYSVCTTWLIRQNRYYLLDLLRFRAEHPDLVRKVIEEAHRWQPQLVLIEAVGHGKALCDDVARKTRSKICPIVPQGDKVSRMVGETAALAAGYVFLPEETDWLPDFKHEVAAFPKGKHDDQVDSMSQFLYWTRTRGPRRPMLRCRITTAGSPPVDLDTVLSDLWR